MAINHNGTRMVEDEDKTRITYDELEKFRLNLSRCANPAWRSSFTVLYCLPLKAWQNGKCLVFTLYRLDTLFNCVRSEFPFPLVSKRVKVRNYSYGNELVLHENGNTGKTNLHVNGFTLRLVLMPRQKRTWKWRIWTSRNIWSSTVKHFARLDGD